MCNELDVIWSSFENAVQRTVPEYVRCCDTRRQPPV